MLENHETHPSEGGDTFVMSGVSPEKQAIAQRHLQRAKDQVKLKHHSLAIRELQDAILIDPTNSEYHALLAKIHLQSGMQGAAKVSLRQALKLNPEDETALECQKYLAKKEAIAQPQQGGFLGGLFGKRGKN